MYRWYILVLFAVVVTTDIQAGTSDKGPSGRTYNTPYPYDSDRTINETYLRAINSMRTKPQRCGTRGLYKATTPLKWSDKLYRASLEHARDMATHNLTHHAGSGKKTDLTGTKNGWLKHSSKASERGKFHGYTYSKAFAFAENVGAGQKNLAEIVKAWMKSPGHCANIMNPSFREMALAKSVNSGSTYKTYWTLDLGYRR